MKKSFSFNDVPLRSAVDSLMKWYAASIVYLDKDIEGKRVSATCNECTREEALTHVLGGTALIWVKMGSQILLKDSRIESIPKPGTVSGSVLDSTTGEWIVGAHVFLLDSIGQSQTDGRRWCPTNQFGFFSLRNVPPGDYIMVVRTLGYQLTVLPISVTAGERIGRNIMIKPEEITLEEVTIEGQRTSLTAAEGISRGIFIRSTPSDHHQYLLDGARVYNPSHYGGVLSTFNPQALNDVQVRLGGIPPYYGGRIGGILDVSTREGSLDGISGSAGAGSLNSYLTLEGPVTDETSFMVSGRRGYPDIFLPHYEAKGTQNDLSSSELIGKLSYRLSETERLLLSGYLGRDAHSSTAAGDGLHLVNQLSWGNATVSLRWLKVTSPSLFVYASAAYSRYDFNVNHLLTDPRSHGPLTFLTDYKVEDAIVRAQAEHYYDDQHTVIAGVELVHHRFTGVIHEFSSQIAPYVLRSPSTMEVSAYLQDQWRLLPGVTAEIGARATNFIGSTGSFSGVDPRFSLRVSVSDDFRIYSSFTSINQFFHPYRNSGIFLFYPTIFWYPSTEKIKPSNSLQLSLGGEKSVRGDALIITGESYFRVTENYHEFAFEQVLGSHKDLSDVALFGESRVYGFEVSLRKRTGNLTGSVTYNLSWETHRFDELNNGNPYSPRFDRQHLLQLASWYRLGESWMLGVLSVLSSDQSPSFSPKVMRQVGRLTDDVVDANGSQLPGFQRIELRVHHRFIWGKYPILLSLRLMNGYGLLDPFVWELWAERDRRLMWTATLKDVKLFPLYPTLGMSVRF